jgi:autotransporter-associated beta strand protein
MTQPNLSNIFNPLRFAKRLLALFALMFLLGGADVHAGARVRIWDGGGANGLWTNATNWDGATPQSGNNQSLVFAGITNTATTNDFTSLQVGYVAFSNTAGSFTLSGNSFTIFLGLTNNSTSVQTIDVTNVAFGAAQTFAANSGDLLIQSSLSGNFAKTFAGANDITINGAISGSGGVVKSGAGILTLSASNAFTGNLTNSAGTVRAISNAFALGAGNVILSGGNLELANDTGLNFADPVLLSSDATITSDRLSAGAGVTHTLGILTNAGRVLTVTKGANVTNGTAGLTFGNTVLTTAAGTFSADADILLERGFVQLSGNKLIVPVSSIPSRFIVFATSRYLPTNSPYIFSVMW